VYSRPSSGRDYVRNENISGFVTFVMGDLTYLRIFFRKSKVKSVVVVLHFPEDYPDHELLVEIKSKTLTSPKLLDGLARVCEEEARKYLGSEVFEIKRNF